MLDFNIYAHYDIFCAKGNTLLYKKEVFFKYVPVDWQYCKCHCYPIASSELASVMTGAQDRNIHKEDENKEKLKKGKMFYIYFCNSLFYLFYKTALIFFYWMFFIMYVRKKHSPLRPSFLNNPFLRQLRSCGFDAMRPKILAIYASSKEVRKFPDFSMSPNSVSVTYYWCLTYYSII